MMEDLWPSGHAEMHADMLAICGQCRRVTRAKTGPCGHPVCAVCGRCPPCDGPLEDTMPALDDRLRWLDHLHECTRCPVQLCDTGLELAAAVRDSMAPGETWEGVWKPR